ncbi:MULTISPECIES: hypothetical protein [Bacillus]|uniref:hypothetical protein n=1 Tax=Bacillus TaxID=1386 RepID=UPI00228054D4|nr:MULTISPECIES: hypothetical protein [Bacillus]MCY8090773.1 hypothetical protein [Bacillus haynesii]MCY8292180.1 hypothetical protein [Bacillus haynesii]MCY8409682.1 hypothetical protein [Bacillus haynesii]MCY8434556.1 hypothetical protein [Bacillus haynesii]MCY8626312.1 hypothetical protein [Bacillus haynesii]
MSKRLDDIQNWYDIDASVSPDDFNWLIGQVRRLQEEKERYKKALEHIAKMEKMRGAPELVICRHARYAREALEAAEAGEGEL